MRVLDLGSGMGDLSMLVASLVGPTGAVVGIDQDADSVVLARGRVEAAGLENVTFTVGDVNELAEGVQFDAVVGRLILLYVTDVVVVLRTLARLVTPGGVIAVQESNFSARFHQVAHLPIHAAVVRMISVLFARSGAHPDNELRLYQAFRAAGLPSPRMRSEQILGDDPHTQAWLPDLALTVWERAKGFGLIDDLLGDPSTLRERMSKELKAEDSFAIGGGLVSAWCRLPTR